MKHLKPLSSAPCAAQTADVSFSAIFSLVADILTAVAIAVTAKESSELPDLSGILGDGTTT